ncbi:MAG: Holliday junction branch migration protein RuvA [Deltaproteobacteria bacterium]|nr:Holliday junction branch migration protein RuvA [Deltaproteobacteria bacterium]
MIGYLKGNLLQLLEETLIVDVGGVGYEVYPTRGILARCTAPGAEIELFVHTYVREEEIRLFGFVSLKERALFELLMSVSGVGSKNALHIISELGEETFVEAVLAGNPAPFLKVKGVGRKIAERVLLETRDKINKLFSAGGYAMPAMPATPLSSNFVQALEALISLGFRRSEAQAALNALKDRTKAPVEELLREALTRLRR